MSRSEGFVVMDVSTSICNDPKFRRLARDYPAHVAGGFMVYVATMGESWRAGRRVSAEDAWPSVLPYDPETPTALRAVGLLDRTSKVPLKTWSGWFDEANARRKKSRDRWNRYNATRERDRADSTNDDAATAHLPRGSDADTASSVPFRSSPSVPTGLTVPSVPTARTNGAKPESAPTPEGAASRGTAREYAEKYGMKHEIITGGKAG